MGVKSREKIFNAALCSGTGNTVSRAIDITDCDQGDLAIQIAASTSAATITVTYEVSHDGTNYDTTTTTPTRTIISGLAKNTIVKGFDVPVAKYMKIRATGTGSNPSGTTVTGYLMMDEI